jgi:hypothetical protein
MFLNGKTGYTKNITRMTALSRLYDFENDNNGGLGPVYFYNKFLKPNNSNGNGNNNREYFDLTVYILLSVDTTDNLVSLIQNNIKGYKINVQKYIVTSGNMESIKTTIRNDKNVNFMIVDSDTVKDFNNIFVSFMTYVPTKKNMNADIIQTLYSVLFYKTQQKIPN